MTDLFSNFDDGDVAAIRAATAAAALADRDAIRRGEALRRAENAGPEETAPPAAPSDLDLLRHAERAPGDPIAFAVVAALRTRESVRRRYGRLLASRGAAHSPLAAAAYSEGTRRVVGRHVLRLMREEGLPPMLVISPIEEGVAPPRTLEAMGPVGETGFADVRLGLPEAIRGHVTLPLDPSRRETADLAALLARPDSALWLF